MPAEVKSPLKSKTVWVNMLVIGGGVLAYVAGHELMVDNTAAVAALGVAVGVINVVLRFVTKSPVK